jgi:peptidoglycan/xylan/chitin deacetylase (PgdA/CDA1 family)
MPGALVISLDFELYWGVRDVMSVEDYRGNLLGVRAVVPALLELFARRDIHATWATVGMLFCATKKELRDALPRRLPRYVDAALSPYDAWNSIGENEKDDPFHFAPSLVEKIASSRGQELATHTFSHYYCLERGQTAEDFDADLEAAQYVGKRFGDVTRSLVFPRNQFNPAYRDVMRKRGVRTFRSNGTHWAYASRPPPEPQARRATRLVDAYVRIAGQRTFRVGAPDDFGLVDVPASAFLRPYSQTLRYLEPLRWRRLSRAMTHAARRGEVFHLWWHPHNFGSRLRENFDFLTSLLDHFDVLRRAHGMRSLTMIEASALSSADQAREVA